MEKVRKETNFQYWNQIKYKVFILQANKIIKIYIGLRQ